MTQNNTPPILSLRNICKSFGPTEVLHDLNLDIHPGEVVALLGENGAGKSTASNIISGSIQATSGEMFWHAPANPKEAIDAGIGTIRS